MRWKAWALVAVYLWICAVGLASGPAHATISSSQVSTTAVGNSATTVFTYPFIIPFQADGSTPAVLVSVTTSGVTSIIPFNQYTIAGVGNSAGGTVTYPLTGSPLTSASTITITRNLAYIQPTAVPNTTFYPHTVEQVADNLDMQIQQVAALGGGGGGGGCGSGCVTALNSMTGPITLAAGSGINVASGGGTITVSSTGGGGGVSSVNSGTGAITIAAGSGITVGTSGSNITVAASGSGSQTVTAVTNIAALRALTSVTVQNVIVQDWSMVGDGGGGVFYYVSADTTSADNSCTIFVDAMSHRWYRVYAGPINVRWCGAQGDGSTNDYTAFTKVLAAGIDDFVPAGNYVLGTALDLGSSNGRKFHGAGPTATILTASVTSNPVLKITSTILYPQVSDMTLTHSGTAITGGDGLFTNLIVGSGLFDNLVATGNWIGFDLGPTDSSQFSRSTASGNLNDGWKFSNVTSGAGPGQVQWILTNDLSLQNVGSGFHVVGTGSGPAQLTLGTWTNLATFSNTGYGVDVEGTMAQPVQGVRIFGGFFGQDGNDEIHLNTYNTSGHIIEPNYAEIAGTSPTGPTLGTSPSNIGSGVYASLNNGVVEIRCGICNGNSYDGIATGASDTTIVGSTITNNGQASGAPGLGRANGVNIITGAAGVSISGTKIGNTNGGMSQKYGVASVIDEVAIAGSDLRNNATSYYAFPAMPTNLQVAAVLPAAANTGGGGGGGCPTSGCTFTGPVIVTAGLQVNSLGIGTAPDGTTAHITGPGGGIAFAGGVNVNFTGATATTGTIQGGGFFGGGTATITGMTSGAFSSSLSSNSLSTGAVSGSTGTFSSSLSAPTVTASSALVALGTLNVNGASGFSGGSTWTGSNSITVGGGVTAANATFSTSLGVGTGASGSPGWVDVTSGLRLNGTPYTNP